MTSEPEKGAAIANKVSSLTDGRHIQIDAASVIFHKPPKPDLGHSSEEKAYRSVAWSPSGRSLTIASSDSSKMIIWEVCDCSCCQCWKEKLASEVSLLLVYIFLPCSVCVCVCVCVHLQHICWSRLQRV